MRKYAILILLITSIQLLAQNNYRKITEKEDCEKTPVFFSKLDSIEYALEKEKFFDKIVTDFMKRNNISVSKQEELESFIEVESEKLPSSINETTISDGDLTIGYVKRSLENVVNVIGQKYSKTNLQKVAQNVLPINFNQNPVNTQRAAAGSCNNLDFTNGTAGWNPWQGSKYSCRRRIRLWPTRMTICIKKWKNNPGVNNWGNSGISPDNTPSNQSGPGAGSQFALNTPGFFDPLITTMPTTPPNGANSIRLGSLQANDYSAQKVENTFAVTATNKHLTYYYAVVLNDGGHAQDVQPYFKIRLRNQNGDVISCASFDVNATSATWIPDFRSYSGVGPVDSSDPEADPDGGGGDANPNPFASPYRYKLWSSVLIPLDNYIGQNVTLSFETSDCTAGAHPAYAYVSASCGANDLILTKPTVCRGNSGKIIAPEGALQYNWTGPGIVAGQTNDTVEVNLPGRYECTMTLFSSSGGVCEYKLDTVVTLDPTAPHPNFTTGNVCFGTPVSFVNTSSPASEQINSEWDFESDNIIDFNGATPPSFNFPAPNTYSVHLTVRGAICIHDTTIEVVVNPIPVANFNATAVCQLGATDFIDLSTVAATGTISSWSWDYTNDGIIDNTTQNPSYVYPNSGNYMASLTVKTTSNCTNSFTLPVNVWGRSIPDFTADKVCFGSPSILNNLTNTSTNQNLGNIFSYTWNYADGSPVENVINGNHTYIAGGNVNASYDVTLTAVTNHGCSNQISKTAYVYSMPTASFTTNEVCLEQATQFTSASNGNGNNITNYVWDFLSDGIIDAIATGVQNPTHVFSGPGDNSTTLVVTTTPTIGLTCASTITKNVWVNPNPLPNFTFINRCVNEQPLFFNASSSAIAIGNNTLYSWSYGDGSAIETTALTTITHSYSNAGLSSVVLTVTSDKGCIKSINKEVEIFRKPIVNIVNSRACDTKAMNFTVNSLPTSGAITNWFWDFNNTLFSLESSGQNVNYIFPSAGNHTVALVAETNNGCKDTIYKPVYVDYLPQPQFAIDNPIGCSLPHCVTFTDNTPPVLAPAVNTTWKWVFGDGAEIKASNNSNQTHCFTNTSSGRSALFDVRLVVTTDKGCTDSLEKSSLIEVYPKPLAQYDVNPNPGNVATPLIYFTNQSEGFTKWWWIFGDESHKDSVNINPTHFYESETADFYNSALIIMNKYGCSDTAYAKVNVGPEFTFYVPNAFTPGWEDGINDTFTGKGIGISAYEMRIYDRWGENIFTTNDITKGWNGVLKNGSNAKPDVYTWKVNLKDVMNRKHEYVGHVTLLR